MSNNSDVHLSVSNYLLHYYIPPGKPASAILTTESLETALRGFSNLSSGANLLFDLLCHPMEIPGDRISAQAGEPLNVES